MNMLSILEHTPLANLTTFEIGGAARYFVEVATEDEIREALAWAREKSVPFAILAGGSNALVSDDGFDGLVIKVACSGISFDGNTVTIDAGRNLLTTIHECAERGLGGWEKMAGIPGSVGGAARGNAGAFGSEIKDFAIRVRAIDTETGEAREFTNSECAFAYRDSYFKQNPHWLIIGVVVQLAAVDPAESARIATDTIAEREKRHLQNVRAAGSYFMNPVAPPEVVALFESEKQVKARENRVPAGWLIEKVGMKGAIEGGAMASLQHPNYLVNHTGTATATEVRALAERVKAAVKEQFGIELHEEAAQL